MALLADPQVILRILCGAWFLPHLVGKIRHADLAYLTFEKAGFKPGKPFLYLTALIEGLAMIGLVTGIAPRIAAGLAVFVLAGAGFAVVRINGWNWRWQKQGPEYTIFWAACCILSVI